MQVEEELVEIPIDECDATKHPKKEMPAFWNVAHSMPRRLAEDHISLLGFNHIIVPYSLVAALISHPDLFADDILVRWMQEQELIFGAIVCEIKGEAF